MLAAAERLQRLTAHRGKVVEQIRKIVYSKTLETVSSARTRIERGFDPEAVRQLKAAAGGDITVGGPDLAAQARSPPYLTRYGDSLRPCLAPTHRTRATKDHSETSSSARDGTLMAPPRPATDAEPLLQGPVLFSVLEGRPDEQADDEDGGQEGQDREKDPGDHVQPSQTKRA